MMRAGRTAALLAFAAACEIPTESPGPYVEKLKANPADLSAMANLAILGRVSVQPLLEAVEEMPALHAAALTVCSVGGEPCWPAMADYLDHGGRWEVKLGLLEVAAQNRWKGALRKLAGRVDGEPLGPFVCDAIIRIVGPEGSAPENPWTGGQLDPIKRAEFDRWVGKNVRTLVDLNLRTTRFSRTDLDKVLKQVEEEFQRWHP